MIAEQMRSAASSWLAGLSADQRALARWPAPGSARATDDERSRWFYTPTDHGGLPLGDQRSHQQRQVMRLLSSGLSEAGYVTVSVILGWENVLDRVEGFAAHWGRDRARDPGLYYLRVFGDPERDRVWSWRFGGHHISVNFVLAGDEVIATTPFFLGADPASAPGLGDESLRPLAAVEDRARTLVRSLSADQLADAVLWPQAPTDIIGGNRARIGDGDRMILLPDVWRGHFDDPALDARIREVSAAAEAKAGVTEEGHERLSLTRLPKGIAGGSLTAAQRSMLDGLIATYTARVAEPLAPDIAAQDVHFAWAGGTGNGEPHYYRLQGPGFLAEFDNTQRDANHAHSVWRSPETDFGGDLLAEHLTQHHRHH